MKRLLVVTLCLLMSCLFMPAAFADVYQLNNLLKNFTSLQANFTSTMSDQQGAQSQSIGTLSIQKPNQFNYEVTSPNKELFISNGKQVWSVEPDLQQVTISPLSQNLSTTPLLLLSGDTKNLESVFKVTQINSTNYMLVPRAKDSMIKQILISFNAKGVLSYLQIDNTMGQISKINFKDVMLNTKLAPSLFHYTPVAGMDVLTNS